MIEIVYKDDVHLQVRCDSSVAQELSDFFTFDVPGAKFMPQVRNRVWDGKIRLFNSVTRTVYTGLKDYIVDFCKVRKYDCIVDDKLTNTTPFSTEDVDDLAKTLKLTMEPRDYQKDAVAHAITNKRAMMISPTASGKSMIIYMIARYYPMKKLIIVPTTGLVAQLASDFHEYGYKDDIHKITAGASKDIDSEITITTWQSIYKMPRKWFEQFQVVIGDEAHLFKAKSLTSIMEKCTEAEYRIGTTGTLDGTQTHQLVLEGLFGPVHKVTTTKDLIDSDQLAKLDIKMLLLKYKDEHCKEISKLKYQEEIDFIVRYTPRNNFISNLAIDQEGNTLILFNYVEKHGKPLHNILKEKLKGKDRKLFYVSGETDVDTRERVRAITEKEQNAIIVASLGTFSTGINIKRLHNLIFASPSKSQIRVLQSIGRGLRKSDKDTIVYDIADDLHWKQKKNYTLEHAAERIKIYSKEKFDYELFEINI